MKKHPKIYNTMSLSARIGGWAYYAFELLALPTLLYLAATVLGLSDAQMNFAYYVLNFVFVVLIFRGYLSGSLNHAGRHMGTFLRAIVAGFVIYQAASAAIGMAMLHLAPDFANVNDQSIAAMTSRSPVLMFLGTVMLVPTAEECLFRGLIFGSLQPGHRAAAYAVSALSFCAVHVMGYIGVYPAATLVLCFLQYVPAGLILCWAYEHCGSIFAPILIHTAVNAVAMLTLFV